MLRKLEEGEPIGTTVAICITDVKSSIPNLKQYIVGMIPSGTG